MPAPETHSAGSIVLKGARQHNLQNLDVRLPRHKLVVVTGPSGSGKSSLAFDTLYAEGQRRYLESLSAYARQFLEQVPKPDVDRVEGLSPALAIEQKGLGHNPRSTVGTVTEILPFLRLLYARLGEPHCPSCGEAVAASHPSRIFEEIVSLPSGTRFSILAPVIQGRRGEHRRLLANLRKRGFTRARVDGATIELDEVETLAKGVRHDVDVVVDRLVAGKGSTERLRRSIEQALAEGEGRLRLLTQGGDEKLFSDRLACPSCGTGFEALEPRLFSFNSPAGACPPCRGLGRTRRASEALVILDASVSIASGGLAPLRGRTQSFVNQQVEFLVERLGFSVDAPLEEIPDAASRAILHGTGATEFAELRATTKGHERFLADFEGLLPMIERRARDTKSGRIRSWCEEFMEEVECPSCSGTRLRDEARAVTLFGRDLGELCALPLNGLADVLAPWSFSGVGAKIGGPLVEEVRSRLGFLVEAGLDYLSLDRSVDSLSGGEGQRVRLATQVGSRLTGVLYILDEPSVGLHARDNAKLISLLRRLADRGNSVIVVEHDRDIIEAADHLLDLGPGAGDHGGRIVGEGTPEELREQETSPTGRWLAAPVPVELRPSRVDERGAARALLGGEESPEARAGQPEDGRLRVLGATARNLKNVDLELPLGCLIAVTGVSGSGKSTLIHQVLYRSLAQRYHGAAAKPGSHDRIEGADLLRKVILIDQDPIGRSPRSTPATFTGVYTHLRRLLAQTPAAKARGFSAGRFSFNTKGGRCEACDGAGVRTLTMDFLPEVQVRCDVCRGRRFNRQTLEVTYRGRSIADFLELTVEDAHEQLKNIPPIHRILSTLEAVGLGYLRLGQSAGTLSGGEAQRLKLAKELSRPSSGDTLYLLDEPTTGLHFQDVQLLLDVLRRLVAKGNTVLVIEHHAEVILSADHVVDLGPEGGEGGGEIVVAGPLAHIVDCAASHTGAMLKRFLDNP